MIVPIRNAQDYFETEFNRLHPTDRLVVVLDPEQHLTLPDILHAGGRTWKVYAYAENDLDFRARYGRGPQDPNTPHIIWITPSPFKLTKFGALNLSFLPDVLRRADHILDISLTGLLHALLPHEVFPSEGLAAYGAILGEHLDTLRIAHRDLRDQLQENEPLSLHHLRAIAIHCLQPDLALRDCVFTQTTITAVLHHYLRVVWSGTLTRETLALFQEQAADSPFVTTDALVPWFRVPPVTLALWVYSFRTLKIYHVPNPTNQLRGLGLLSVDIDLLAPHLDTALALWDEMPLRAQLIQQAESVLTRSQLAEMVALFPLHDATAPLENNAVYSALTLADTPALIYGLAEHWLIENIKLQALPDASYGDTLNITALQTTLAAQVETSYTAPAQSALTMLQEWIFIARALARSSQAASLLPPDLATLVDAYVHSGIYRLELACAIVESQVIRFLSSDIRSQLLAALNTLKQAIWARLDVLDAHLAALIGQDPSAFESCPRLATQILHNTVFRAGIQPTKANSLWILVFDGMRWDTWREVVLPELLQHFEIVDEGKAYLSLLPSLTVVARTGLLAGCTPQYWRGQNGQRTRNEAILLARLFDLDQADRDRWLRLEVKSERDTVQHLLLSDSDNPPINVLIYNLSDSWIHDFQGTLVALNKHITQDMRGIVADLHALIGDEDWVVVTSDHGFVELDPRAGIPVTGDEAQVFYRYLLDLPHVQGTGVPRAEGGNYTLAHGRAWFKREGGRAARYTHGGISLGEMVVPGIRLRKIVEPFVSLSLSGLPPHLRVVEKEEQTLDVTLHNAGNRLTHYELVFSLNPEGNTTCLQGSLGPRASQSHAYRFTPRYSPQPTQYLEVKVTYRDIDGRNVALPTHSTPIAVEPRKDVVEIDFGGLDKLDNL